MEQFRITLTTAEDIPALQDVLDKTNLFPSEMLPGVIAPYLSSESRSVWLTCHRNGEAVGVCFAEPEELTDGTWNMLALAVLPNLQGKKAGTALVQALEDHLKSQGQRMLVVDTSSKAKFALTRRFYVKNQYEEESRIRDFWAKGDHKVTFRKVL